MLRRAEMGISLLRAKSILNIIKKTGNVLSGDYADDLRLENSIQFKTFRF